VLPILCNEPRSVQTIHHHCHLYLAC